MTLYIAEVFNNFFISKLHGYLICLIIIDKISLVYLLLCPDYIPDFITEKIKFNLERLNSRYFF